MEMRSIRAFKLTPYIDLLFITSIFLMVPKGCFFFVQYLAPATRNSRMVGLNAFHYFIEFLDIDLPERGVSLTSKLPDRR